LSFEEAAVRDAEWVSLLTNHEADSQPERRIGVAPQSGRILPVPARLAGPSQDACGATWVGYRIAARFALSLSALTAIACAPEAESESCGGLLQTLPDTPTGTLQATRDGAPYTANAGIRGYRLQNEQTNIEAGDVSLYVGKDKDGNTIDQAISEESFPICIFLNDQSDGTTYAMARASGSSYLTDSTHTGTVVILGKDGDEILGRFAFEALQNSGSGTTRFEDGSFRLGPR
jgi:hypothetical protein